MSALAVPGVALAWLRQSVGLTVDETARRAGVAPAFLARVEAGDARATPAWLGEVATVLADALADRAPAPGPEPGRTDDGTPTRLHEHGGNDR
ncbi:XRE family transcriptional regulator [Xylanimonas allomyrinae]|uniref:XRE family transcriptional regulator n=1 Tax=Xylanimonas allomyrinae TaxID=2509459 RepID=A0A4P6EL26_9MICO|nr:helix-turn-helix transcriptional regulator [Xylanimonas allomyrinae]QAY62896.1 XRE family transcriptional regulator [Xylanimonas allomyrinae]